MTGIDLHLDGDDSAVDLIEAGTHVHSLNGFRLTVLPAGMASGLPSVAVIVKLDTGEVVIAQTSLAALCVAVKAIRARYGDPSEMN